MTGIAAVTALSLAGCLSSDSSSGGGSGSSSDGGESTTASIEGVAIDGYLHNARVCLDASGSFTCASADSHVWTDENGRFSFEASQEEIDAAHFLLIEVISGQTIDRDSGDFVSQDFVMVAPPGAAGDGFSGELNVNPFWTLAATLMQVHGISFNSAAEKIVDGLGLATFLSGTSVTAGEFLRSDFVEAENEGLAEAKEILLRAAAPAAAHAMGRAVTRAMNDNAGVADAVVIRTVLEEMLEDDLLRDVSRIAERAANKPVGDRYDTASSDGTRTGSDWYADNTSRVASSATANATASADTPGVPGFRNWESTNSVTVDEEVILSWVMYWGQNAERVMIRNADNPAEILCDDSLEPNGFQQQGGTCAFSAPATIGSYNYEVVLANGGVETTSRESFTVRVTDGGGAGGSDDATVRPGEAVFNDWLPGVSGGRVEGEQYTLAWSKWSGALASEWQLYRNDEAVANGCQGEPVTSSTWDLWQDGRIVGTAGGQTGECTRSTPENGDSARYHVELCNSAGCVKSEHLTIAYSSANGGDGDGDSGGRGGDGPGSEPDADEDASDEVKPPRKPVIESMGRSHEADADIDVTWNIWANASRQATFWTLFARNRHSDEPYAAVPACEQQTLETNDQGVQSETCSIDGGTWDAGNTAQFIVRVCRTEEGEHACADSDPQSVAMVTNDGGDDGNGDSGGNGGDAPEPEWGVDGIGAFANPVEHSACMPAYGDDIDDYEISSACVESLRADDNFGGACYRDGSGTGECDNRPDHDREVVAYAIEWGIYGRDYQMWNLPASRLTHINYSFLRIGEEYSEPAGSAFAKPRDNSDDHGVYVTDPWASLQVVPGVASNWSLSEANKAGNLHYLRLLREKFPHLKVLATIGGWTMSSEFFSVANDPEARKEFAQSAANFVRRHDLDGIDIDWEFPGYGVGGDSYNTHVGRNDEQRDDTENFTLLMKDLREALDELSAEQGGRHYELAAAVSTNPKGIARIDYAAVMEYMDSINLMTYDYHGAWDDKSGHQTPLYNNEDWTDHRFNISSAVHGVLQQVPAAQRDELAGMLNIGVASYGRGMTLPAGLDAGNADAIIGTDKTGPAAHGSWEDGIIDYADMIPFDDEDDPIWFRQEGHESETPFEFTSRIAGYGFCEKRRADGNDQCEGNYSRGYDAKADAAYLYDATSGQFFSWDDPETIAAKTAYVVGEDLGGVIVWEATGDKYTQGARDGELFTIMDEGLSCTAVEDTARNDAHRNSTDDIVHVGSELDLSTNDWYDPREGRDSSPYNRWICQDWQ